MRFSAVLAGFVTGSLATTDFQCWNFGQENEIRQEYRNQVNDLRSQLAQGNAANKDGKTCPSGKNIYRLDWDCILENVAQKVVDQCVDNPQLTSKEGETLSMVHSKKALTTCNPTPLFRKQVKEWWDVVEKVGLDENAAFKSGLESFAVLANGLSTRIGCAQRNCNGDLHMACVVYGKAATTGQAIYEVGPGCSADTDCTTYEGSTCKKQKKFCAAGYPKNGTVTPPTVGTTTTTTTATTPITTTATTSTKKPGSSESKHCKGQETMNGDPARDELLKVHNEKRATIAKGGVEMGNKKLARSCPRMKKFVEYNCELEKEAYATASKCNAADPDVCNENWFKTTATSRKEAANKAMESWYNEIKSGYMDQKPASQNLLMPDLKIRHFARMVWDINAQMGCAIHECKGKEWHVVCRYGKGVGEYGNRIYFMGPNCKQCNTCEDGLCTA